MSAALTQPFAPCPGCRSRTLVAIDAANHATIALQPDPQMFPAAGLYAYHRPSGRATRITAEHLEGDEPQTLVWMRRGDVEFHLAHLVECEAAAALVAGDRRWR